MQYGGQVAGPVFAEIVAEMLPALGIEPVPEELVTNPWGGPNKRVAKAIVPVPDVIGKSVLEAQNIMRSSSLMPEVVGQGTKVLDQEPKLGQSLKEGSKVYLFVDTETILEGPPIVDAAN